MSIRRAILLGGLFSHALFAQPALPQPTIAVRLFEILHPQALELKLAEPAFRNFLANGLRSNNAEIAPARLHGGAGVAEPAAVSFGEALPVFVVRDAPGIARHTTKPIRVVRQGGRVQVLNDDFDSAPALADTITVATTSGQILAAVKYRNGKERFAARPYAGAFKIYVAGNELCIINLLAEEDYLAGVLAAELRQAPFAALQAQAVAARTYLLKNWRRHQQKGYQACDLTHCQRYAGSAGVDSTIQHAIASTAGEILTYKNLPIEIFYSSTCGGRTANDLDVWSSEFDHPYLISVSDSSRRMSYCAKSPHFRWQLRMKTDSLLQLWQQELGEPIVALGVSKRNSDGRVRELALMGQSLHLVSGEKFRAVVCRVLGWNSVKSTAFDLQLENNTYVFIGKGLGHGVGMCQFGAMGMARAGHSYQKILKHYFPKTMLQKYEHNLSSND